MDSRSHLKLADKACSRIDTTKTEDMVPSSELRGWLVNYLDLFEQLEALERAYKQACTNLATIRPDLTRDLSIGETADLYYDALLAGWGGIEGYDPGRLFATSERQ